MNAVVLSHATIEARTIIGACTLVSEHKHLPEGVLALGVPAKIVRELREDELAHLQKSAEGYYQRSREHASAQAVE
jgi:carbonic anhydrase/acetyltransferase-like protein (isoleucine patch superfamily)